MLNVQILSFSKMFLASVHSERFVILNIIALVITRSEDCLLPFNPFLSALLVATVLYLLLLINPYCYSGQNWT